MVDQKQHTHQTLARHGFTLIELLVVITIISVLMSLVLPSLNKAREQTRTLVCSTKMRQVGVLASAYQADSAGHMLAFQSTAPGDCPTTLVPSSSNRRDVGYTWSANLIINGYVSDDELLPASSSPFNPVAAEPYWEGNLRKKSPFLCPSGKYFAGANTRTFSSIGSSRAWPDGAQTTAARDILDTHLANGALLDNTRYKSTTYHVTLNSYDVSMHTAWLLPMQFSGWSDSTDNLGWVPKKEIRPYAGQHLVASPSNTLYLAEAQSADIREATMATETPYTTANRRFRIPHQDKANFMAVDGHVGMVERQHFGTTNINERPFVWGEYRGSY